MTNNSKFYKKSSKIIKNTNGISYKFNNSIKIAIIKMSSLLCPRDNEYFWRVIKTERRQRQYVSLFYYDL